MSDDLRDRIAGPIWQNSSLTLEGAADIAQTIIADLGLVVERAVRVVDVGAGPLRIPETRVVGKWERS